MIVVCTLIGVAAGATVPLVRGGLDTVAVIAARDEIFATAARARALAVARGGAVLVLDATRNSVWIDAGGAPIELPTDFEREFGVRLSLDGTQAVAEVAFDALGVGRVASRTIRITRGSVAARLTISAFGRLRAW